MFSTEQIVTSQKHERISPEHILASTDRGVADLAGTLNTFVSNGLVDQEHLSRLPVRKLVELGTRFNDIEGIDKRKFRSVAGTAPKKNQLYPDRQVFFEFLAEFQHEIFRRCDYKPTFVVHGSFADPHSTPCRGDCPTDVSDLDMEILLYWWDMPRQLQIERDMRQFLEPLTFEFKPNFGFADKQLYELKAELQLHAIRHTNMAPPYMSIFHPHPEYHAGRLPLSLLSGSSVVLDGAPSNLPKLVSALPNFFPDMPFAGIWPTNEDWERAGSPTISTDLIIEKMRGN